MRGTKGVRAFHDWLRQQVAANRPWDELARDVLTGQRQDDRQPGRRLLHRHRRRTARGRPLRGGRLGGAGVPRHAHRLRPVPQPSAGDVHAGRLLPLRRLLLARQAGAQGPEAGADRRCARRPRHGRQAGEAAGRRRPAAHRPVPQAAAAGPLAPWTISPGDDPRVPAGGVDDRSEERVFQRRDGQSPLAALPRRRPGRAGGRPARQQPADQPRTVAGAQQGVRRAASST